MKKFLSIFMVAVMVSTMGIHNQVIADMTVKEKLVIPRT